MALNSFDIYFLVHTDPSAMHLIAKIRHRFCALVAHQTGRHPGDEPTSVFAPLAGWMEWQVRRRIAGPKFRLSDHARAYRTSHVGPLKIA